MDIFKMFNAGVHGIIFAVVYAVSLILPLMMGLYLLKNFLTAPRRRSKDSNYPVPTTKFAVLIPARNEESVIADTVTLLRKLDYPQDLFDVAVIADNCSDRTAEAAARAGAIVFERSDLTAQSKAHALKWFFDGGHLQRGGYGAVCLVDADTVLDSDFLRETDRELAAGFPIVHGRCGSINPYDSFTSSFMTVLLSFQNRIWHLPQANLLRSGFFAGTGVCIKVSFLEQIGWNINTLVEDAEYSIQAALNGGFVRYCDTALFYVEQVNNFRDFWKQQRRWRTGAINCLRTYGASLLKDVFIKHNKNAIAPLILVMVPPFCILSVIQAILLPLLAFILFGPAMINAATLAVGIVVQFAFNFAVQSMVLLLDGRFSFRHWKGIFAMFVAPFFYGVIDTICFIKPVKQWNPMEHGDTDYHRAANLREEPEEK